jgi:hypothetical protein
MYMLSNNGVGPRDANEFKRFIRTEGAAEANRLEVNLTALDSLFVSPRDGQPYTINYGLRQVDSTRQPLVIVAEKVGHNSKRMVGFVGGWIEEVNAEKAAQLGLQTN